MHRPSVYVEHCGLCVAGMHEVFRMCHVQLQFSLHMYFNHCASSVVSLVGGTVVMCLCVCLSLWVPVWGCWAHSLENNFFFDQPPMDTWCHLRLQFDVHVQFVAFFLHVLVADEGVQSLWIEIWLEDSYPESLPPNALFALEHRGRSVCVHILVCVARCGDPVCLIRVMQDQGIGIHWWNNITFQAAAIGF